MNKLFFKKSLVVVLGLFLIAPIASAQVNWTPPTGLPTGNNVPAPVNVGPAFQSKEGSLEIKGNLTSGESGSGGFFSENQSYLRGMTIFQEKADGGGPNFLASFLMSGFYNDVLIGDGVYTNPDLELQGRFRYVTKNDNGTTINPLNLEEMQEGGYDRILIGDENGNLRWGVTADIIDNNGGGVGGDLPTCANGQIIQYNNGVWGCVDPSTLGGNSLPNGVIGGEILIWDSVNQTWKVSPKIRVLANNDIYFDSPNINVGVTGFAGSTKLNSPDVKIPLGGTASPGKVLTAVDAQGTLGWSSAPINNGTGDLPPGVWGQTLWFNGATNAWEATSVIQHDTNQSKVRIIPDTYLDNNLFIKNITPYDTNLNPQAPTYLPRMCVDKKGEDGIAGSLDDGKVYICPGESGFVFATPREIDEGDIDNTLGTNPVEITTNGNGTSTVFSWTVPPGITVLKQVKIASGAGGGGGGGSGKVGGQTDSIGGGGGGGGGGGSGFLQNFYDIPVTPGESLCITVGKGGDGGFGVSEYRNRNAEDTIFPGSINSNGDKIQAMPGKNGGNSYLGDSQCDPISVSGQGSLTVVGGGGGFGGFTIAPDEQNESRGGLGGNGGIPGYFDGQNIGNWGQSGYHGWTSSPDEQSASSNRGKGGDGGSGGSGGDGLVAFGGTGGTGISNYINIDINKNNNYSILSNPQGEKGRILADHGKQIPFFNDLVYPAGGAGGGGAAAGGVTFSWQNTVVGPGTCVTSPYAYFEGEVITLWDAGLPDLPGGLLFDAMVNAILSVPLPSNSNAIGFNPASISPFNPIGVLSLGLQPCTLEIGQELQQGQTSPLYAVDWNGNNDTSDSYNMCSVGGNPLPQIFQPQQAGVYNSWFNCVSSYLGETQANKYLDNLCIGNWNISSISGISTCGGDGSKGGDGFIYIQY